MDLNEYGDSRERGCEKCLRVNNRGPENRLYYKRFFIASYKYKNNGFMWWQDSTSNMYEATLIQNICWQYIIYETDKTCVQLSVIGLGSFIHIYIWSSVCLVQNRMVFVLNFCPSIRICLFDREKCPKVQIMFPVIIGTHAQDWIP